MNSTNALVRYSLKSPLFYRRKRRDFVSGLACGTVPSDPGLWNLAWLSCSASQYQLYESCNTPDGQLPMWAPSAVQLIVEIGRIEISDRPLREWAAELPARKLVRLVASNVPTIPFPIENKSWDGWLEWAAMRAKTSSDDTVVSLGEYPEPGSECEKLACIEEAYVRTLPPPVPPVYKCRKSGKAFDLAKWLRSAGKLQAN